MSRARERIESLTFFGGVVAVCFEWLAVAFFYFSSPATFTNAYALSYFAMLPQTRFIFSFCLSLAAISFWIFIKWHLSKHYITPVKTFTISMLAYLAVAILPFSHADLFSNGVHSLLAFIFTVTFVLGIYFMAKNNADSTLRLFSIPIVIFSTILFLFMTFLPDTPVFLLFEILVGFSCQIWTLGITYHAYVKRKSRMVK